MQAPEAAARELRRAVDLLGLVGGYLPSNVNGRYLDAPEFSPIFEAATDLDVPLFLHPSNPPARERMADYELAVVAGYLFDTTLNVFHMIFGGLLDRYPTLRISRRMGQHACTSAVGSSVFRRQTASTE